MSSHTIGAFLLVACVGALPARAEEKKEAASKRIVHVVQHGSAKDLAAALAKHFKGEADVSALPEPNANCLLIRANADVFDEVVKLLVMLDRRPRLVSVEVIVADVALVSPAEKGGAAKLAEVDESIFNGPAPEVVGKLHDLQRAGKLSGLTRYQVTAPENRSATMAQGETKPFVMATNRTATGLTQRSISYRNLGTHAQFTPRVGADGVIALDMKVERSTMRQPEDGIVVGEAEKGEPIRAPEFVQATFEGKVSVGPGRAVPLQGVKTTAKGAPAQTLIVVTARVLDETAKSPELDVRTPREDGPPRRPERPNRFGPRGPGAPPPAGATPPPAGRP